MIQKITDDIIAYETHIHTSETSRCANADAKTQVNFYKKLGYTGIIITDHFLNGNTTVPRDLAWEERVKMFCIGFENARLEGEKVGLDVFFGWEYAYGGTDLLTYGLDKDWILNHEDVDKLELNEYCDLVHESGGIIIHAHPFREANYIPFIRLFPRKTDAVEVYNANRTDFENEQALAYAKTYGLKLSSGSDNHTGLQERYGGIASEKRFETINDFILLIKRGEGTLLAIES